MVPFTAVYFFVSLAALAIATYTDLRERLVSNRLTYGVAVLAILLKASESYLSGSIAPLESALLGGAIGFAASYVLYRLGVWAGGDVKLVTAISILNPINYAYLAGAFGLQALAAGPLGLPVFSIALILCSGLMVFPIGVAMTLSAAFSGKGIINSAIGAAKTKAVDAVAGAALFIGGASSAEWAIGLIRQLAGGAAQGGKWFYQSLSPDALSAPGFAPAAWIAGFAVMAAASTLPKGSRVRVSFTYALAGLALAPIGFIAGVLGIAVPLVAILFLWKLYAESRKMAFSEIVKSSKIEEGMVPDGFIVERKGRIFLEQAPGMRSVINNLISNRMRNPAEALKPLGKVIASPADAGGLTKEAAGLLKKMAAKGLGPRNITVKKTMAFVPAILAGYVALQLGGDFIWKFLFGAMQ